MGSFTSVPAIKEDVQDADFEVGAATRESLLSRCLSELSPPASQSLLVRNFAVRNKDKFKTISPEDNNKNSSNSFRLLTWNILAQALALEHDNFVGLPEGTLNWTERRLRILHEILLYNPDVICLQVCPFPVVIIIE